MAFIVFGCFVSVLILYDKFKKSNQHFELITQRVMEEKKRVEKIANGIYSDLIRTRQVKKQLNMKYEQALKYLIWIHKYRPICDEAFRAGGVDVDESLEFQNRINELWFTDLR